MGNKIDESFVYIYLYIYISFKVEWEVCLTHLIFQAGLARFWGEYQHVKPKIKIFLKPHQKELQQRKKMTE